MPRIRMNPKVSIPKGPKSFTEYLNYMRAVHKSIERKVLIVFDDMSSDMISTKNSSGSQ